jgi:photosystem II stability/assembly factor-like uncharacterized protein
MKAPLLLPLLLLLMSCGAGMRKAAVTGPVPGTVARADSDRPDVAAAGRVPLTAARARADQADEDQDSEESPADWAAFYLLRRTGGAPLPVEKLLDGKRLKDKMPARAIGTRRRAPAGIGVAPRDVDLGNWQPLGPGNIGGRTRAFVIRPDDPNTMYAGSEGGGIWKTTDGGNTWNPLTDMLPSLAVATLAMDPNDPNTLYAGTGEWFTGNSRGDSIRGAGIFKSSDGGNTWTQLPKPLSGNAFDYTNKVVVSPNNSQHIYTANWVGVYYSQDGGNTWQLQLNHQGNQDGCQDLVIRSDQQTDYLYVACAAGGAQNPAIYRNTDAAGAGQWQMVFTTADMARTTLAIAPSNPSVIYAAVSGSQSGTCPTDNSTPAACYNDALLGVWQSTSNGDSGSWTQQVSFQDPTLLNTLLFTNPRGAFADICSGGTKSWSNQGDYDNIIAVDPTNPNVVWVGGIDLFRSDDGGHNWGIAAFWEEEGGQPQGAHADNHMIVFQPGYDGAANQTMFVSSDGGIYRTDNALAATAKGPRAACAPYTTSVAWHNVNNGYAVTQFYQGSVYPGGGSYLGGSQDNNMERGSDATGPNAWTEPNHIGDGGFSAIDPTDPNIWYILGTHMNIQKTTNGGATFSTVTKGITENSSNFLFIAPLAMDPANSKRLYTGGKTLWRTTDGAANWSAASSAIPSNAGSISYIAVSPTDPNHAAFGTSQGFLFTSTSATTTGNTVAWTSTQPRTGFVSSVTYDPTNPNTIYVTYSQYKQNSSQSHVYQSTDGGATWTGIDGSGSTGLPDIPVFALIVDPQNPSSLYLGTDIGLFVSADGGTTWARDANPFADAVTEVLVLDRSSGQNTLFAFTHGRGVWRTVLPGSGDPCQYAVSANSVEFPAYGANATFNVTTGDGCAWSVFPTGSNFTTIPATGTGNGSFVVNARFVNNTAQAYAAAVSVQNQLISVTQDAALVAGGNDEAASAFSVGTLPAVVIEDTSGGTQSASDPVHSCTNSADFNTLWFSVTPQNAGTLSLTYFVTRKDIFADAGAVMTVYRNVNGAPGPELTCQVLPQTNSAGSYRYYNSKRAVQPGDSFFVEISATLSGAPTGASLLTGNLTLEAVVQ